MGIDSPLSKRTIEFLSKGLISACRFRIGSIPAGNGGERIRHAS